MPKLSSIVSLILFRSNIVGEKVFERIKNVNEDSIVVSVQYNGGNSLLIKTLNIHIYSYHVPYKLDESLNPKYRYTHTYE